MRFATELYGFGHGLAATLPNDWVFRIRAAAFLLVCYVLYRLSRYSSRLRALQAQIVEARSLEQDVAKLLAKGNALD
jgi:hypothetical protein